MKVELWQEWFPKACTTKRGRNEFINYWAAKKPTQLNKTGAFEPVNYRIVIFPEQYFAGVSKGLLTIGWPPVVSLSPRHLWVVNSLSLWAWMACSRVSWFQRWSSLNWRWRENCRVVQKNGFQFSSSRGIRSTILSHSDFYSHFCAVLSKTIFIGSRNGF